MKNDTGPGHDGSDCWCGTLDDFQAVKEAFVRF